ncbi:MAG: hypothetical protein H6945_07895 [Zoogloeaceae bacterium]|nr:hypothetical protein [Rhodocyclaceae bacterium]MCP5235646.1 hypothetical protein [Zoogloeaceae bacterium]
MAKTDASEERADGSSMGRRSRVLALLGHPRMRSHLLITAVFVLLFASFVFSLARYWTGSLEPRLYLTAETQARILAQSQAAALLETIEHGAPGLLRDKLFDLMQEILLVEDPATGGRIVLGLDLQIDYEAVPVTPGSLELQDGARACERCFHASIPLIGQGGRLLGVAEFLLSPRYFDTLSGEMRSKLIAESSLAMGLMALVWITMLVMFHRLYKAKLAIEASDRAKTRFMANVTHELRTPLNAILGYTQLYKQDAPLMAGHGEGISSIDRSAEHLLMMINDILDFSRMGADKLALHPAEVALPSLLETLVEMMEVRARLKGIRLERQFQPGLPAVVLVDEKRLRQVLLNLLGNAVKFTERGGVLFSVERVGHGGDGKARLRFGVLDSGIGIGPSELDSIFIAFRQIDNPITRAEGSGLGLTISQQLVGLMGSELRVESEPGVGSHFWFDIDVAVLTEGCVADGEPTQPADAPVSARTGTGITMPDDDYLDEFVEHVRRHNVLGLRRLLERLGGQPAYRDFIEYVQPYVRSYRFRPLLDWLTREREN